jgi:hypothetical protein
MTFLPFPFPSSPPIISHHKFFPIPSSQLPFDDILSLSEDTFLALRTCDYESVLLNLTKLSLLIPDHGFDSTLSLNLSELSISCFESPDETLLHDQASGLLYLLSSSGSFPSDKFHDFLILVNDYLLQGPSSYAILTLLDCIFFFPEDRQFFFSGLSNSAIQLLDSDDTAFSVKNRIVNLFKFFLEKPLEFDILINFSITIFNSGSIAGHRLHLFLVVLAQRPESLEAFDCQEIAGFLMEMIGIADSHLLLLALSVLISRPETIPMIDFKVVLSLVSSDPSGVCHCMTRAIDVEPDLAEFCLQEGLFDILPLSFLEKREYVRCLCGVILKFTIADVGLVSCQWIELMVEVFESVDQDEEIFEKDGIALAMLVEWGCVEEEMLTRISSVDGWEKYG